MGASDHHAGPQPVSLLRLACGAKAGLWHQSNRVAEGRCDNQTSMQPSFDAIDGAASPSAPDLTAPHMARRMACWIYEGMLLFGVVFITSYLFSSLTQTRHALQNRTGQQAFLFLVLGIYFTWFWHKGQTLAMKTWHIRVVDRFGRPLTQARALLRYVLAWLWFLPPLAFLAPFHPVSGAETSVVIFGWVIVWMLLARFLPQRQFLHDLLAGTRLVTYRPSPSPKPKK